MNVTQLPFFQHVRWQPDKRELRRFSISMLVGFTLIGIVVAWRADSLGAGTLIVWGIGVFLAITALVPGLGRAAYLGVYLPTSVIGYIVSHVILALIFFLVFTPIGLLLRIRGKDLLQLRPAPGETRWRRVDQVKDHDSYYHQF